MKKTEQISIRFTKKQMEFITKIADDLQISKADVIRMLVVKNMPIPMEIQQKEVIANANMQTNINNII